MSHDVGHSVSHKIEDRKAELDGWLLLADSSLAVAALSAGPVSCVARHPRMRVVLPGTQSVSAKRQAALSATIQIKWLQGALDRLISLLHY